MGSLKEAALEFVEDHFTENANGSCRSCRFYDFAPSKQGAISPKKPTNKPCCQVATGHFALNDCPALRFHHNPSKGNNP